MRSLLLPFHDDEIDLAALETALLLARRFNSYLEGLFVWQPPQIIAGAGEGITLYGDYVSQVAAEGRQLAGQARQRFRELLAERDIAFDAAGDSSVSAGWYQGEGLEDRVVGDYGRVFDLIVIGRTSRPASGDWQTTCEAALFESGRPVLLAPSAAKTSLGERIVIAWNGSTETARTIALGMPLLCRAKSVTVLSVEGGTVPGPNGEQITAYLQRHDINAQTVNVAQQQSVGETMLNYAAEHDADLLFKGAYTQSRVRQMIFGGATRHILNNATLPVLLAH